MGHYTHNPFMSDNNEDEATPGEAKSKSPQSKPLPKKRGGSRERKPSGTTESENRKAESDQSSLEPPVNSNSEEAGSSAPSERKQAARRPAKKKTSGRQTQSNRPRNDSNSDEITSDEKQSSTKDSSSSERSQSARRPAKRKSDSNRRRSGSSSRSSSRNNRSNRPRPTLRQPPVNPEELQAKAWDLYRADINEESTAMFNEEEATDLVRRSFILADIFLRFRDQLLDSESGTANNPSESPEDSPS